MENMKNVLFSVYSAMLCLCACVRAHLSISSIHVISCQVFVHVHNRSLPHAYMTAHVCECDSVCEPVGSLPVVCSRRYAYGETAAGAPSCLCSDERQQLIEWPGTQPPFLIITAVQSLLITLKVCRAPHSPVMLQAVWKSESKIRHFWQKSTFKKAKRVEKGPASKQCSSPPHLISLSSSWWSRDTVYY